MRRKDLPRHNRLCARFGRFRRSRDRTGIAARRCVVNKTIPVILCAEENVQGSHGAAIGELDEETLFYFGARGMDRTQAENTMARAKLEAKIQKIGDADIEQKVKTQLAEVLDRDNR